MKILLIQHTHTDIGYTDRQEKIMQNHIDYIKQAIKISEKIISGEKSEWEGFRWTCEMYWAVELFFNQTNESWHKRLIDAIHHGHIELTGNYLNCNDLVDYPSLKKAIKRAVDFSKTTGKTIDCGMAADVNGFTWGYSQALYDCGIRNFFSCVHTHHGMFPLFKKQTPFYWETPNGDHLLVWSGDHYNTGNHLGFCPNVEPVLNNDGTFDTKVRFSEQDLDHSKKLLDEYLEIIKKQDYPYDVIPIMISGVFVDNAPPSGHIVEYIKAFNERFGTDYDVKMSTLDEFFSYLKQLDVSIPTYKGDWTDWWSDGFMSTPASVIIFREAQKLVEQARALQLADYKIDEKKLSEAEYYLMLFAEHTWGYFSSISEPYFPKVTILDSVNQMYAGKAHEIASQIIDDVTLSENEAYLYPGRPLQYRVINPFNEPKKDIVKLLVNWWETFLIKDGYEVIDVDTNEVIPHQQIGLHGGAKLEVWFLANFESKQKRTFRIVPKQKTRTELHPDPMIPADRVVDFKSKYHTKPIYCTQHVLESPYVRIEFEPESGIVSWIDKKTGKELIREDRVYNPLTPIYEVTEHHVKWDFQQYQMTGRRNSFGRNRKGFNAKQFAGKLINTKVLADGNLFGRIELLYELPGTKHCSITLTTYANEPKVEFSLNLFKDSEWNPESIYLSLPFTIGNDMEMYAEKSGSTFRPRIDQIPGTLQDFYTLQNGFAYVDKNKGLAVSTLHAPVIQIGSLKSKEVQFFEEPNLKKNQELAYSWVINNYWETNFSANTGGLFSFEYAMYFSEDINTPEKAIEKCRNMNQKTIQFRVKK